MRTQKQIRHRPASVHKNSAIKFGLATSEDFNDRTCASVVKSTNVSEDFQIPKAPSNLLDLPFERFLEDYYSILG